MPGASRQNEYPAVLAGSPNVGIEWNVGRQFTVNGDVLWMPYMFKKHEEVFRTLIGSIDLRYYVKPKYYYTNNAFDGFYIGPYAMYGNFNIGLYKGEDKESYRRKGWGVSAGRGRSATSSTSRNASVWM